ncbi:hypothetical protein [Streptomyces hirsutus]|uniref:hypothetical protein n=1 Tax=Streptomyces hirsutus TaxID=35620 RepID=UPI003F4D5A9F
MAEGPHASHVRDSKDCRDPNSPSLPPRGTTPPTTPPRADPHAPRRNRPTRGVG